MISYLKSVGLVNGQFEQTSVYVRSVALVNISVRIAHFVPIYEVAIISALDHFNW